MSYKRLGDYIQQVNVRNTALEVDTLLGVSITKKLIPSIANTIGTDMSVYKIIKRQQFAYGTVTSRNGDKISIALADEYDKALVSQIYVVFEVIDKDELLPEYLMMWFSRPEFDRYARYHSHGSTRETFDWDNMCEVQLPIPSIDKQREIVAEYQSIENKITINNQICEKLEATAQALYRHWFVDFEFPNEEGKPYKSSGGTMVYNEELEKGIPEGWEVNYINEYVKLSQGLAINASTQHYIQKEGMPLLRITDLINNTREIFISDKVDINVVAVESDIIVSRTGQVGLVFRNKTGVVYNNCFKVHPKENLHPEVLYWFLKTSEMFHIMNYLASGSSAQLDLTHKQFYTIKYLLPDKLVQVKFNANVKFIGHKINVLQNQNQRLIHFQSLLLSRLAKQAN